MRLDSAVSEGTPGRDTEWNEVGQGNLPVEACCDPAIENQAALVYRGQDRSNHQSRQS